MRLNGQQHARAGRHGGTVAASSLLMPRVEPGSSTSSRSGYTRPSVRTGPAGPPTASREEQRPRRPCERGPGPDDRDAGLAGPRDLDRSQPR